MHNSFRFGGIGFLLCLFGLSCQSESPTVFESGTGTLAVSLDLTGLTSESVSMQPDTTLALDYHSQWTCEDHRHGYG